MEFSKKTIVVSGAASPVGKAICTAFAKAGGAIAACDKNLAGAEQTAQELRAAGFEAKAFLVDLYALDSLKDAVAQIAEAMGRIDVLVNAYNEEMPDEEQRESRLPGYTTEDNPVLGKPKSRKGKAPRRQRQSPQASQRKFQAQWASHRSMVEKQF